MWSRLLLVAVAVCLFCLSIDAAKSEAERAAERAAEDELEMLMDEDERMPPKRAAKPKAKAPKGQAKKPKQAQGIWDDDSDNKCDPNGSGDGKCSEPASERVESNPEKPKEYRSRADELKEMYAKRDQEEKERRERQANEPIDPDNPDWVPNLPNFTPEEAAQLTHEEKKEIMREGMRQIRAKNKPKREKEKKEKTKKKNKKRTEKVKKRKEEKAKKKQERRAAKAKKKEEEAQRKKEAEEEERRNRPPPPPTFGGLWSKRSQDICRQAVRRHELGQLAPVYTCREIEKKIKAEFTKWGDGGSKSAMQNAIHDRLKNSPFADHAREAAEQVGDMPPAPELSKLLETAEKEPYRSAGMLLIKRIVIDTVDNFFNQTWKKENKKRTIDAISTHVVRSQTMSWLANVEAENKDVMRTMNREYRFR